MKIAILAGILLFCGCDTQPRAVPSARIPEPAAEPVPAPHEIALASASPEAIRAYREGRELYEVVRPADARLRFAKAIELDPGFAFAHAMLAMCLQGAEAQREMDRAWEYAQALPDDAKTQVQYWRAELQGDVAGTDAALARLGELAPNDWRVAIELALHARVRGDVEAAIRYCRRATALNPDEPRPWNDLGYGLADAGQFDGAVAAMRRYVALKRDDPNPVDSLGEIVLRAGRWEDADAAFSWALRLDPRFWVSATGLAYSHFFRGDWDGGRAAIAKSLPDAPTADARIALEKLVAWSYFAEGRQGQALQALDVAERDAHRAKLAGEYARVAAVRAVFLAHMGQAGAALTELAVLQQRAKAKGVTGIEQNALRGISLGARLEAEVKLGHVEVAQKALQEFEAAVGRPAPGARALLDAGKGDWKAVLADTESCTAKDPMCMFRRALAQEKLGDRKAALVTRAALSGERTRDQLYAGAEPTYLYAYAQIHAAQAVN